MTPRCSIFSQATGVQWRELLEKRHIIKAVRNMEALAAAAELPTETVCLLFGNPLNIDRLLRFLLEQRKLPPVNLDLLTGFSRDIVTYACLEEAAFLVRPIKCISPDTRW